MVVAGSAVLVLSMLGSATAGPPGDRGKHDDRGGSSDRHSGRAGSIELTELGRYTAEGAEFAAGGAEIVAHDPGTQRLFVANGSEGTLDVLDIADPDVPALVEQVDLSDFGPGINGVGAGGGMVGVAVEPEDTQRQRGRAVFIDPDSLDILASVRVGYLPDALLFSPDGKRAVVANEGEPNADYSIDPRGTVSIIDLSGGADRLTQADVTQVGFGGLRRHDLDDSVRIFGPDASVAQDLEPENVAFSPNSKTTYVTLQENNAIVAIDLASGRIRDLFGLGFKDHSEARNAFDASNEDGGINIRPWPVKGIYQPDAIAGYAYRGQTYLVTANEGDARDYETFSEEARFGDVTLCEGFRGFQSMSPEELQDDANLGRLNITTANGFDEENDCLEEIYSYGARSFSIYTADGKQVFDSGREFEEITAELLGEPGFNSNNDESALESFDGRSDDKGPEPEGLTVGQAYGETYAFIGLERVGGVMAYRVSDPRKAEFVDYATGRDFTATTAEESVDLGPEGVIFITAKDSPTGRPLVVLSHEITGTTTLYQVDPVKPTRGRR